MDNLCLNAAKACSQPIGYVSISVLQRTLLIGYEQAKNILQLLIKNHFCEAAYTPKHGHKIIKEARK